MTTLKMAFHSQSGRRVVEIFDDSGRFIGAIYPTDDGSNGVHIVSKHFDDPVVEASPGAILMPGYLMRFKR